ncbi:MAG: epoxyqueuosine reductase [Candidatus Aureabacteria bacterium]|nr:epoxyqueuosine reductase [Candidatus Auribacterota bacterium]
MSKRYNQELASFFHDHLVPVFGIASLDAMKKDPCSAIHRSLDKVLDDLSSAISFALKLSDKVMESLEKGPNILYSSHYSRINQYLDATTIRLTQWIEQKGFNALPIAASIVLDFDANLAHLSHRHAAYYAGLGWYGRNNLLVHPHYGARLRFATVLTDLPLQCGEPLTGDCGDCRDCTGVCPAGAIGDSFRDFKKFQCAALLRNFAKQPGICQQICGMCIKACRGKEKNHG